MKLKMKVTRQDQRMPLGWMQRVCIESGQEQVVSHKESDLSRRGMHSLIAGQSGQDIDHSSNQITSIGVQVKPLNFKPRVVIKTQGCVKTKVGLTCAIAAANHPKKTLMKPRSRSNNPHYLLLIYLSLATLAPFTCTVEAQLSRNEADNESSLSIGFGRNDHKPPVYDGGSREIRVDKSLVNKLSSAHLLSEPRDLDLGSRSNFEGQKEQSRLEKLCLQTSSVLAAVLPTPFGGHKRSVLCQFFGHLPFRPDSQHQSIDLRKATNEYREPMDSVAVLHQHQQQLISFPTSGKHPIELVLEHHQKRAPSPYRQPSWSQIDLRSPAKNSNDLKSAASVIDFAYQQRLEPPPDMFKSTQPKHSATEIEPLDESKTRTKSISNKSTALHGSSQLMSTSGWRILDQALITGNATETNTTLLPDSNGNKTTHLSITMKSSQRPLDHGIRRSRNKKGVPDKLDKISEQKLPIGASINATRDQISSNLRENRPIQASGTTTVHSLIIGKPPNPPTRFVNQLSENLPISDKWNEEFRAVNKSIGREGILDTGIRTIEVVAQENNLTDSKERQSASTVAPITNTDKPAADVRQVQKREELVIASINNLTRIAFGNQLRDTVKVINKLIDQQADLFKSDKPITMIGQRTVRNDSKIATHKAIKQQVASGFTPGRHKEKQMSRQSNSSTTYHKTTQAPEIHPAVSKSRSERLSAPKNSLRKLSGKAAVVRSRMNHEERKSSELSTSTIRSDRPAVNNLLEDVDLVYQKSTVSDIARSRPTTRNIERGLTTRSVVQISGTDISSEPAMKPTKQKSATTIPWLITDKSMYKTTLFEPNSLSTRSLESSTEDQNTRLTSLMRPDATFGSQKHTTKNSLPGRTSSVESNSLTTLKMSLTTKPDSTSLDPALQTKWVPSTIVTPTSTSRTPKTSKPISFIADEFHKPTVSTAMHNFNQSLLDDQNKGPTLTTRTPKAGSTTNFYERGAKADTQAAFSTTPSQEDAVEAKASETISRYTTHWDEANEVFATTRRAYQQPLPQVVDTGEFFSAETIASWPEKYQKVMGQALETSRTTPVFETTRREGESYESSVSFTPRHSVTTLQAEETSRPMELTANRIAFLPGVTILPANHKLAASGDLEQRETSPSQQISSYATTRQQETTLPKTSYTLIGPYTGHGIGTTPTNQQPMKYHEYTEARFPQVPGDLGHASSHPNPVADANNMGNSLRPPYLDEYIDDGKLNYGDTALSADSRHHKSKNPYESMTSSDQNLPESQNSFYNHRFNLSALKFLAQSLLNPSRYLNQTRNDGNSTELFNLLDPNLPSNHYELSSNETHEARTNQTAVANQSILSRASSILSDLKQLEHKKAAAILAAIRYQVPSPLVRPSDPTSDNYPLVDAEKLSDRSDSAQSQDDLTISLRLIDIGHAGVEAALSKQKVIPRDELDALLNHDRSFDKAERLKYPRRSLDDKLHSESQVDRGRNLTAGLLERLIPAGTKNLLPRLLSSFVANKPVNTEATNLSNIENIEAIRHAEEQDPSKYLQLDNQSPSDKRISNHKSLAYQLQPLLEDSDGNSPSKTKETTQNSSNFSCRNRAAGFYPDEESACQTFYHCSNTEHVLTFSCPRGTRFDEKLLKCGPWFDISCDLGRTKQRRPHAIGLEKLSTASLVTSNKVDLTPS